MDERTLLGQRVKRLRRLKGYTQEQLAERIEINPKDLSSIERGAENPTLDLLIRLAKGLQVDLYALARGVTASSSVPPAAGVIRSCGHSGWAPRPLAPGSRS
jgi:transcriptional regulator with XRE-family HTH domain